MQKSDISPAAKSTEEGADDGADHEDDDEDVSEEAEHDDNEVGQHCKTTSEDHDKWTILVCFRSIFNGRRIAACIRGDCVHYRDANSTSAVSVCVACGLVISLL